VDHYFLSHEILLISFKLRQIITLNCCLEKNFFRGNRYRTAFHLILNEYFVWKAPDPDFIGFFIV
jgi:hypothetical protein